MKEMAIRVPWDKGCLGGIVVGGQSGVGGWRKCKASAALASCMAALNLYVGTGTISDRTAAHSSTMHPKHCQLALLSWAGTLAPPTQLSAAPA